MPIPDRQITGLLRDASRGKAEATDALFPLVYSELHRIATAHLTKERPNHTLQPTALVHDAYLKIIRGAEVEWQDRVHFYSIASRVMRRILVDYARARAARKRGGPQHQVTLEEGIAVTQQKTVDVIALDEALTKLGSVDERQAQVVEMRFFAGMEEEEIASILGISSRTVKRDWRIARAWLYNELRGSIHSG